MYIRHSEKYEKGVKIIHPGEYYVSEDDEIIGTLLGSCVAVCLIDHRRGIAGMNHFMLPGRITSADIFADRKARYGITAINHLVHTMEAHGTRKEDVVAKVFGGGHVLDTINDAHTIPQDNIRIARVMMEMEDIHITHSDVGGIYTRKLLLDVKSGTVYLKKTTRNELFEQINQRDLEYARRSFVHE